MKRLGWLAVSLCLPLLALAQSKTDSLKSLLAGVSEKNDSVNQEYLLSSIGYEFISQYKYDSALYYYYKALAIHAASPQAKASTLNAIGVAYNYKGYPDSCIYYYKEALTIYEVLRDTSNSSIAESNLAILYKDKGLYETALEYAFRAISKLEKQKPDRTLASLYNTVGLAYQPVGDFQNALDYFNRSLKLRMDIGYTRGVGQSFNNIGEAYMAMKQYDSALTNLLRASKIKRELKESGSLGATLILIGEVYLLTQEVTLAENYLTEALMIKTASGERLDQAIILNDLASIKLLQKDYRQANEFLAKANKLVVEVKSLEQLKRNLEIKVTLSKMTRDYQGGLLASEQLIIIKDSILNIEKAKSLIAMQTRYETEEKVQQISFLQRDQEIQRAEINSKRIWIQSLIISIFLLLVIAVLIFHNYRLVQKSKQKVETLLKELHHRVKNNLQILSSVLSLQSQYAKDDDTIQVIKASESRVNAMALIHKKLYSVENNRTVNMKEYVTELSEYLMHSYGFSSRELALHINSDIIFLDVDKAIPVGLILNELLSNAFKYAYPGMYPPEMIITMRLDTDHRFAIELKDNGKGIEPDVQDTAKSFGLKMINTLVKELKGKLTRTVHEGTSYALQIPTL